MTDHAELLELAELYALGGLSPEERARLAEHVADGCPDCEAVLARAGASGRRAAARGAARAALAERARASHGARPQ